MAMLPILIFLIFNYLPMYGQLIAFQDYDIVGGVFASKWVGLKHIRAFVESIYFVRLLRNTFLLSFFTFLFGFPAPIILALLLNEMPSLRLKRAVQSISYLPHFISTVVVVGLLMKLVETDGIVHRVWGILGIAAPIFLQEPGWFRPLYIGSGIWQGVGWGTIVYLAALTGIPEELYEAAVVDGANRWRRVWHITLPGLMPTMVILMILRMGQMLDVGFEKVFLMYNELTYETADVFSTYVYRRGIMRLDYSFATAVGLFNSVIAFLLLISANRIARKVSSVSLW